MKQQILLKILEFNRQQKRQGLKILTQTKCLVDYQFLQRNQKQEIILKNLKAKLGNYCILFTDQKNLQKRSTKVWLTLFKTWKQFLWTVKTVKQVNHTDLNWI